MSVEAQRGDSSEKSNEIIKSKLNIFIFSNCKFQFY